MKKKSQPKIKVFLVDDHPAVREGVRSFLTNQGSVLVVGEAADAQEALRKVKKLAPEVIGRERKMYKGVSANVDFYSGFVYRMLDLPPELFTPIFAVARIAGWCAHRIEEIVNNGKIIRPAYKSITAHRDYIPLDKR